MTRSAARATGGASTSAAARTTARSCSMAAFLIGLSARQHAPAPKAWQWSDPSARRTWATPSARPPLDEAEADQGGGQRVERQQDVDAPLVSEREPPKAGEPG